MIQFVCADSIISPPPYQWLFVLDSDAGSNLAQATPFTQGSVVEGQNTVGVCHLRYADRVVVFKVVPLKLDGPVYHLFDGIINDVPYVKVCQLLNLRFCFGLLQPGLYSLLQ